MSEEIKHEFYDNDELMGKVVSEVVEKMEDFEDNHSSFFDVYNEIADHYRMIKKINPKRGKGMSHVTDGEMHRATETLCTVFFKILTAYDPNFYAIAGTAGRVSNEELAAITAVRVEQDRCIGFKRNLLKHLRSVSLFGGGFVDEPWIDNGDYEATDFRPKSMLNIYYDRRCRNMDESDFSGTIDYVSRFRLAWLVQNDANNIWNKKGVKATLNESISSTPATYSTHLINRLKSAGYNNEDLKGISEYSYYRGYLNCMGDFKEYLVGISNRKHVVKMMVSPFPHGERGLRYTGLVEFENEPLGYGVGNLGLQSHKEILGNRARIHDTVTFNLFNMMKISRYAGVDLSTMQVKPWNCIEMDDIAGMEAIKPDMMGVNFGMRLEDKLKEDFRATVAATGSLQAVSAENTAREAILNSNEAIRRVSVYADVLAESLIRQRNVRAHKNNMKFMSRDMWLNISGREMVKISPLQIEKSVNFLPKIVTDKDFAPARSRRLIEFLTIMTNPTINNSVIPDEVKKVTNSIIKELSRGLELDMTPEKTGMDDPRAKMLAVMQLIKNLGGGMAPQNNSDGSPVMGVQTPAVRGPQENLSAQKVSGPGGQIGVPQ